MFKNILVPVETGNMSNSGKKLELAKKLMSDGGKITVLNVVEHLPEYVTAELPENFAERSAEAAKAKLQELTNDGVDFDVKIEVGHAASGILHHADDNNCDLIIVASHKPEMMDYLLGSTASRVVRRAKCSVMVAR